MLEKFDNYFIPRRNIIHERALFHQCIQSPSQTIESYVRMLFEQAEHCNFTNKEENIRDQLVIGLQDKTISRKLQLESNLTLDKAITVSRTYETVTNQMLIQKDNTNLVNVVTSHRSRGRMRNRYNSNRSHSHSNTSRGGTNNRRSRGQSSFGRGFPSRGRGRSINACRNCSYSHQPMHALSYRARWNHLRPTGLMMDFHCLWITFSIHGGK